MTSDVEVGERDPNRFYCPYPSCNRSFAELWRLKVHYRAPPDIRGSGKERGHGTELSHCPKCGKELQPGKHHVGCGSQKNSPQKPAKRIKLEQEDTTQVNGQQQLNSDLVGVPALWGQTLVVNQQQLAAIQEQYVQQMQQQQQQPLLVQVPQSISQQPQSLQGGFQTTGEQQQQQQQQMVMSPNMIPVMLGSQPGIIVLNTGLQASNYAPLVYNTPVQMQIPPIQVPQIPPASQQLHLQWINNNTNNNFNITNNNNYCRNMVSNQQFQQNQYISLQSSSMVQLQPTQLVLQENLQSQQQMYSEADSSQKERTIDHSHEQSQTDNKDKCNGSSKCAQFQMPLQNMEFKDDILGELKTPPPSLCPSPPPLPQGCEEWDFHSGQLFDFDRCLKECSKNSHIMHRAGSNEVNLLGDIPRTSKNMEDVLQILFEDDEMPFVTTHMHRRTHLQEEEEEVNQLVPPSSCLMGAFANQKHGVLDVEESVAGSSYQLQANVRPAFPLTRRNTVVHSSGSSQQ